MHKWFRENLVIKEKVPVARCVEIINDFALILKDNPQLVLMQCNTNYIGNHEILSTFT